MMFFGFYCVRKLLICLNLFYIFLSIVLISVAAYANSISIISSSIIGGITFCGIFLLLISFMGLIGTYKHHQVILFFYMLLLCVLFFTQFIIACVCLGVIGVNTRYDILKKGWDMLSNETRKSAQERLGCCGFDQNSQQDCPSSYDGTCYEKLKETIQSALKMSGGIGLAFTFTHLFGVWMAIRFRNQRDPRCNPNAFL